MKTYYEAYHQIEKTEEAKTAQRELGNVQEQLREKMASMVSDIHKWNDEQTQNSLSLQSQSSQLAAMEAQVMQYQTNQQTNERLLQAKNDEIMLKQVREGGRVMHRRRNETRLLDLNRTLQNKNAELEKRVETLRREYATDCVSSDAIGMSD